MRNKQNVTLWVLISLLCLLAWLNRFVQDDAFISFRYAENFSRGYGLVYNQGDKVEGYTNFLWTLFMSLPHFLKIDAVLFSQAAGIILFAGTLLFVYKTASLLLNTPALPLLAVLITGSNYSFLSYATGGMETQLAAFFLITSVYLSLKTGKKYDFKVLLLLSFISSLYFLTRPDALIYIIILVILVLMALNKQHVRFSNIYPAAFPFLFITAAYLAWKINYYGELLPNSAYVKLSSRGSAGYAFNYLYTFFTGYWLILFLPFIYGLFFSRKYRNSGLIFLLALLTAAIIYVFYIGGDFMEFRVLVPVIPLLFILILKITEVINLKWVSYAAVIFIIGGSINHAVTFRSDNEYKLLSVRELNSQIHADNFYWAGTGKQLAETFGERGITIATTAAGAVPYYSGLRTIDMHGLTDRWVARNGITQGSRPGHQKIAPLPYLIQRHVNILLGHPFIMWNTFRLDEVTQKQFKSYFMYSVSEMPAGSRLVKLPLINNYCLIFIYLEKNNDIDKIIYEKNLESKQVAD